ncbi:MAG: hypothetical protein ABSA96_16525, partial [Candidatus Acidiferrales bacterium]
QSRIPTLIEIKKTECWRKLIRLLELSTLLEPSPSPGSSPTFRLPPGLPQIRRVHSNFLESGN